MRVRLGEELLIILYYIMETVTLQFKIRSVGYAGEILSFFTILWYAKMDFQIGRKNYV